MNALELAKNAVCSSLQLGDYANQLSADTQLAGNFPEFNSLTVVMLVTTIESHLGCSIDDREISEDIFETLGTLARFIEKKMA